MATAVDLQATSSLRSQFAELHTPADGAKTSKSKSHLKGLVKSTKGTYQFLPPEAMSGDAFCAFKADIWAIGVTIYTLLFGSLPFYSPDVVELFEKIEKDPLEFPARCKDDDAKDLLRSILEKDPEKRISLEGILRHRWTHRNVNVKSLHQQVRATKEAPALSVEEHEVGSAVGASQFVCKGDGYRVPPPPRQATPWQDEGAI